MVLALIEETAVRCFVPCMPASWAWGPGLLDIEVRRAATRGKCGDNVANVAGLWALPDPVSWMAPRQMGQASSAAVAGGCCWAEARRRYGGVLGAGSAGEEGCSVVMLGTCGVAGSVHASWLGTGGVISSMPSAAGTGDVRSIGGVAMGVASPGWREETSTKRTPNAQTTDRSINKVHLPTVFCSFVFFPFRGRSVFSFWFRPR